MKTTTHSLIDECKVRASILLKTLRGPEGPMQIDAAKRFRRLPAWSESDQDLFPRSIAKIRHRDALAVIAGEVGYPSWEELAADLNTRPESSGNVEMLASRLCPPAGMVYLNLWFADYREAQNHHADCGGFLLPYRRQFFICEAPFITTLGLNPEDPDWDRIKRDWIRPNDFGAWRRLNGQVPPIPLHSTSVRASRSR